MVIGAASGGAEAWSWNRIKLHGPEAAQWFSGSLWSVHDTARAEQHVFVDEFTTPTLTVRRIWHTPLRLTRVPNLATSPGDSPLSIWIHVDGDLAISMPTRTEFTLTPGAAFFHTHPPAAVANTRPTARFEILLSRTTKRGHQVPKVVPRGDSSAWSALTGVVNAVLNARVAPEMRTLALYAHCVETLAEALWLESAPALTSPESDTFIRALEFIVTHASDASFTIETLARMLGVTRSHVSRLFRQRGTTASRTLKRERVHRALNMLAVDPPPTLQEVARSCGFSSIRHLRESLPDHSPQETMKRLRRASSGPVDELSPRATATSPNATGSRNLQEGLISNEERTRAGFRSRKSLRARG